MPESELTSDDLGRIERVFELLALELANRCNGDFRWDVPTELTLRKDCRPSPFDRVRFTVEVSEGPDPHPPKLVRGDTRRLRLLVRDRTTKPGRAWELSILFPDTERRSRVPFSMHLSLMSEQLVRSIFDELKKRPRPDPVVDAGVVRTGLD